MLMHKRLTMCLAYSHCSVKGSCFHCNYLKQIRYNSLWILKPFCTILREIYPILGSIYFLMSSLLRNCKLLEVRELMWYCYVKCLHSRHLIHVYWMNERYFKEGEHHPLFSFYLLKVSICNNDTVCNEIRHIFTASLWKNEKRPPLLVYEESEIIKPLKQHFCNTFLWVSSGWESGLQASWYYCVVLSTVHSLSCLHASDFIENFSFISCLGNN